MKNKPKELKFLVYRNPLLSHRGGSVLACVLGSRSSWKWQKATLEHWCQLTAAPEPQVCCRAAARVISSQGLQPVCLCCRQPHSVPPQQCPWAQKGSASRPGGGGLRCPLAPFSSPAQGSKGNSSTFPWAPLLSHSHRELTGCFPSFLTLLVPAGLFCSNFLPTALCHRLRAELPMLTCTRPLRKGEKNLGKQQLLGFAQRRTGGAARPASGTTPAG